MIEVAQVAWDDAHVTTDTAAARWLDSASDFAATLEGVQAFLDKLKGTLVHTFHQMGLLHVSMWHMELASLRNSGQQVADS